MSKTSTSRVVETAINADGISHVASDRIEKAWEVGGGADITELFHSPRFIQDMSTLNEEKEEPSNFNLKPGQIRFFRNNFKPSASVIFHNTTTVDYIYVADGEIEMHVGEPKDTNVKIVTLKAGDTIVQKGAVHSWKNTSQQHASLIVVMLGVEPHEQFNPVPEPTK